MPAKSLMRPSGPLKPKPVATRYLTAVEEKIVIVRELIVIVKVVRVEFAGRDHQGIIDQMLLPPELNQ
jgi:hypothetical protein